MNDATLLHRRAKGLPTIFSSINRNPVADYERAHLQRSDLIRRRRQLIWILLLPLLAGITIQIGNAFLIPLSRLIGWSRFELRLFLDMAFTIVVYASAGTLLLHNLVISSAAIRLASTTIAREKQGRTWENLLLTTTPARRLVNGKWWGVIRVLWDQYRWTLPVRGVIGGWLLLSADLTGFAPSASGDLVLLSMATIMIIPMINAAYTASLGILASCFASSEAAAIRIGGLILSAMLFIFFGFACLSASFLFALEGDTSSFVLPVIAVIVTAMDGGLISLFALIDIPANVNDATYYFVGIGIWIVLFVALTWLALSVARGLVIGQGVLRR